MPSEERISLVMVKSSASDGSILEIGRWGTFVKALRVTGWVLRFMANVRTTQKDRKLTDLTYEELIEAKKLLFKCVQKEAFSQDIQALKQGKTVYRGSAIAKLDPFLAEDGLLRVKGRLQQSDLTFEEKHPVILPKCHLVHILIRHQHEKMKHAGVDTVISALRNNYWIIGLRRMMKSVKKGCISCQRVDAAACNQVAAPLPDLRVKEAPPFTVTGMDYAGPLYCCDLPNISCCSHVQ